MFIFFVIFIHTVTFYNNLINSVDLLFLYKSKYVRYNFILFLGSFIGIPPLFGFFVKVLLFVNLLVYQKYIFFICLLIINLALLVFYLQQVRFLQTKYKNLNYLKYKSNYTYANVFVVTSFQFFNVLGFFLTPALFKMFILSALC